MGLSEKIERPEEPKSIVEPPPVIAGSVIGYRAWRIVNWQLYGTGVNRAWVPGVNEATCNTGRESHGFYVWAEPSGMHAAPAPGCHCGITALARFTEKDEHWRNVDVFGAIEAWGESESAAARDESSGFHLHRNGFRARYGKVVLLAVEDDWPAAKKAAVRALASEHEADICKREHLEDAAKEHGQLVPDELLEWVAKGEPVSPAEEMYLYGGGAYPTIQSFMQQSMLTTKQMQSAMAAFSTALSSATSATSSISHLAAGLEAKPHKPSISQTLGYPGPPANPTVKGSKGQRIRDSKAVVWVCVKTGKPGRWEREE